MGLPLDSWSHELENRPQGERERRQIGHPFSPKTLLAPAQNTRTLRAKTFSFLPHSSPNLSQLPPRNHPPTPHPRLSPTSAPHKTGRKKLQQCRPLQSHTLPSPSCPLGRSSYLYRQIQTYYSNKNSTKVKDKRKAIDIVKLNAEVEQSEKRIDDLQADIDEIAKELEA